MMYESNKVLFIIHKCSLYKQKYFLLILLKTYHLLQCLVNMGFYLLR
ncbi:hypothetical protein B4125_2340 [Bacillus paralicheniformis]|uniref:Uncharacterized protein n=1 Tax=Bacillus paralicheniformis TaxID=1648923 RepID=A0A6I7TTS6_9BACI|nr:hypothetical protein SC10_B2orf04143 [Bacillus paralicheniformis]OLF91150.1 hypothetical protein B4121_2628 [Bacillus paralicheniformis]OLG08159.1 hypothetical protein B4125_2340 [Bacillus paralicheniformis]TWJ66454.1 hypothetical protein CHCC5021_0730 [Bacillus paralicheniformis]TWJ70653.1 hypothetical protein CHCC5019_3714 [Bacillus paralicheniformis]